MLQRKDLYVTFNPSWSPSKKRKAPESPSVAVSAASSVAASSLKSHSSATPTPSEPQAKKPRLRPVEVVVVDDSDDGKTPEQRTKTAQVLAIPRHSPAVMKELEERKEAERVAAATATQEKLRFADNARKLAAMKNDRKRLSAGRSHDSVPTIPLERNAMLVCCHGSAFTVLLCACVLVSRPAGLVRQETLSVRGVAAIARCG